MDLKYILEQLFPYMVALYLLDCVTYVRRHHLLFASFFGKAFRLQKSGVRMVGLLPNDQVFLSYSLPIFFSSQGVHLTADRNYPEFGVYDEEDFDLILYEDIETVTVEGKVLMINGNVSCHTPSCKTAVHLARFILNLKEKRPSMRSAGIRAFLAEATDIRKIRALLPANSGSIFWLKILSSLLFVCVFMILPLCLYAGLYVYLDLFLLLIFMAAIYITIPVIAFRAHKKMYRGERAEARTILPAALSPLSAMHVLGTLTTETYARFDFLAVAQVLMSPDRFRDLMRKELFRIRYAKTEGANGGLREYLRLREESYHRMLEGSGISLKEVLAAPRKQDDVAASYCPLCGTEYLEGRTSCYDCRIDLKKFDPPAS